MALIDSRLIALFTVIFFLSAAFVADGVTAIPH